MNKAYERKKREQFESRLVGLFIFADTMLVFVVLYNILIRL